MSEGLPIPQDAENVFFYIVYMPKGGEIKEEASFVPAESPRASILAHSESLAGKVAGKFPGAIGVGFESIVFDGTDRSDWKAMGFDNVPYVDLRRYRTHPFT